MSLFCFNSIYPPYPKFSGFPFGIVFVQFSSFIYPM